MSVRPELAEVLRLWVRKAEHDLEAARRIMAIHAGCPFDAACFHCQQAVEKYLKALLTLEGIPAPRTHDLEQLILLVPGSERLEVPVSTLAAMNPYAVEVRYADDWREPQLADAVSALEVAQRVRLAVRRLLPDEVLDSA